MQYPDLGQCHLNMQYIVRIKYTHSLSANIYFIIYLLKGGTCEDSNKVECESIATFKATAYSFKMTSAYV